MKLLTSFVLFVVGSSLFAAAKPNFVVIFTDDQTLRAIGYNNPVVKTPNLDGLALQRLRLNRAFVASPICVASRASIYTGMFPQQHGSVA
jgi:arylsulfatase A-like enzyme